MSEIERADSLIALEKQSQELIDQMQGQVDAAKGKDCTDEAEAEAKIREYARNHSETGQYEYLVRGATLVCSNGSHKRKINLPKCHGVYVGEHPVLHELECVAEPLCGLEKCNVTFFGVCMPQDGQPPQTEVKTYGKTARNSKDGVPGTVTGHKCQPVIVGCWNDTYSDTRIVDNGDKNPGARRLTEQSGAKILGNNTVTTGSFLICKYGGLIEPIDSGQRTLVFEEDFYNSEDFHKVVGYYRGDGRNPVEKGDA